MRGKTGADREISVNTYTGGFTTMLNHHLRNRNLSLKAVGLLSKMLSLPPDWDYSIRGLATLNQCEESTTESPDWCCTLVLQWTSRPR